MGAHQKVDRIARNHLERLVPACSFPRKRTILYFEGDKGPDAIKRKSPAKDEPWHYIQPFDNEDVGLIKIIEGHYGLLVDALRRNDDVRAAFEAAWLSHAIVDGLTPAHHYPYEEKLVELRNGEGIETRTTIKTKLLMPGETRRNQLHNNWKMWGPKGLFTTHAAFEWGFATVVLPLRLRTALPQPADIDNFTSQGVGEWFRRQAQEIATLGMYENFYKNGWTPKLARQIRRELAPAIVRSVTLVWYGALMEAKAAGPAQ
ncbi:MAG: hypothetical protein JWP13_519 [Candidatus Saccharibacteria bacterium]|nr:hypothetical protein [Candidatus Saccharibacteria bacterium]